MKTLSSLLVMLIPLTVNAADVTVRLTNAPSTGSLIFQVYGSADTFGDLRDPLLEFPMTAKGDGDYQLSGVAAGTIALVVYYDENANGRIDKNFIGIPREKLAISNDYQPKGPPSFSTANFELQAEQHTLDMEMYRFLGNRGRFGVGVGAIGRSSPYVGSTESVVRAIPAITYVGERLQWFGPALRYGIAGSGRLRLAAAAEYRIGSYEQSDSSALSGLGDRESTITAGLGLQYEISRGFELDLGYQHDVLDRIGGGLAKLRLSRGFPWGPVRFAPQATINWMSSEMSNYNFGVPLASATVGRPAYALGSTTSFELGLGAFIELTEDWQIIVNIAAERLDSEVKRSPIVADDNLFKGFAMISYIF